MDIYEKIKNLADKYAFEILKIKWMLESRK